MVLAGVFPTKRVVVDTRAQPQTQKALPFHAINDQIYNSISVTMVGAYNMHRDIMYISFGTLFEA